MRLCGAEMRCQSGAEIVLLCLVLYSACAATAQVREAVLLVPFEDHSYFRGTWDIHRGIPRLLGELLHQSSGYVVVPMDTISAFLPDGEASASLDESQTLRIGRAVQADLAIMGDIGGFTINRFNAGNPFLGGYTAYTAVVEVEVRVLRTLSGDQVVKAVGKSEVTDRDLGLTLLGKPTRKEAGLNELNQIPFGTERFCKTIIGKATLEALRQVAAEIQARVSKPHILQQQPKILSVEGGEGFISLGVADGIATGHKFPVCSRRENLQKIGVVQIVEVLAQHLSRVRILEGQGAIREGDILLSQ